MTRRDFARVTVASLAAPFVRAQTSNAKPGEEKAKQLIDKTLHALGGDAFRNLQDRTETGRAYSFYHEQISGLSVARVYTKYLPLASAAAVKMVQRQVLGKKQEESVIFTEKGIWDVTFRGAKQLPQDRLDYFRESTLHDTFYILRQRLNEPGLGFDYQGPDVVDNQSAEKVEIFDGEDRTVLVWISATTFHPIQQRFTRWDPLIKDRREEVTRFSTYRDCGNGVMLPWTTERDRDKERIFQMYSTHVTVTEPIADSMFELPPGVTIPKK